MQSENRLKFSVFIIESPSAVDFYHGRTESQLLHQAINLNQIRCTSKTAINLEAFTAAIQVGLREEMEANPGFIPMLHISAHGFSEGIVLSSGEIVYWKDLRELLKPVNKALNGALVVCMSSCEGHSGSRMAMALDDPEHPFFAIVGNGDKPTWPQTAVAFATFYHQIASGRPATDAVDAMGIASCNNKFFITTAEQAKQGFLDFIKNRQVSTQQAAQELRNESATDTPSELSKWVHKNEVITPPSSTPQSPPSSENSPP